MRNLFDQYNSPENRLTHALGCCLQRDRRLLSEFIRWATGRRELRWRVLKVVEQRIPGTRVEEGREGEASLPDLWIHGDGAWSLVVESKVMAPVKPVQLRRHRAMAVRNGFTDVNLLVIAPAIPARRLDGVHYKTWTGVYAWARRRATQAQWAACLAEYLEIAEARMTADGYLTEGLLTKFNGIPFGPDYPYTYREAKRVLRLALAELRRHERLSTLIDARAPGRPAITGSDSPSVWDIIRLRAARGVSNFASFPHLTLSIQERRMVVIVSLPNATPAWMRRNLTQADFDEFCNLIRHVEAGIGKAIRSVSNAYPFMEAVQKRYRTQRSVPVDDARLELDLRTAVATRRSKVRIQRQWLKAVFEAMSQKRSHLQVGVGAVLRYEDQRINSAGILDVIASVWMACRPWIDVALKGPNRSRS